MSEPAAATGRAEKKGLVLGESGQEEEGRGAEAAIRSSRSTREFQAAPVQSTANSPAELQSVTDMLSLAALQWDYHKGTEARLTSPKHGLITPLPHPQAFLGSQLPDSKVDMTEFQAFATI